MGFEGKEAIILALYQLYLNAKPLICKGFRFIQQALSMNKETEQFICFIFNFFLFSLGLSGIYFSYLIVLQVFFPQQYQKFEVNLENSIYASEAKKSANKSKTNASKSTPIKKNPDCLYVPESFVPYGVSFQEYKKEIKKRTGVKCLLFIRG